MSNYKEDATGPERSTENDSQTRPERDASDTASEPYTPETCAELIERLKTSTRTKCEGGSFPKHVIGVDFTGFDFANISAKEVVFESCKFIYCTFNGTYFRKAQFNKCDFTGSRFKDCNFRDCTLSGSDFKYTQFSGTLISTTELLLNAPTWLNVKREFMMSLRKNAESVGDVESAKMFIREELKAARKYCQEGWRHQGSYYKKKYPSISDRLLLFLESVGYGFDWHFWGHGEYPAKLGRFILISLLMAGAVTLGFDDAISLNVTPVSTFLHTYVQATIAVICTFLGVSRDATLPSVPEPLRISLVLFRYVALGFFTSSLFRRLSRR